MSEFKIAGDSFVSQWNGSSANPGTALAPYAHPSSAPNSISNIVVLGTGYYKGGYSGTRLLQGDGKPILDLLGQIANLPSGGNIINIHFKNGELRSSSNFPRYTRCIFENITLMSQAVPSFVSIENIYFGSEIMNLVFGTNSAFFNSIILVNISGAHNGRMDCCYVDKNVVITADSISINFINNLFNGVYRISGFDYELKKSFDGSDRPDANPSYQDLITIYPQVYTNGNFAGDPKIVDLFNRIVEPTSDLLKRSNTNGFIGGVRPGKSIPVNSSDSDVTITTTNINTSNPTNWVIQTPATSGTIKIVWKLSDNISEIQRLLLDALLSFDGSVAGGTVGNNNVPDIFPTAYTPLLQAGLKPNRLTYALRTSQSISKPVITAEWDNDNVSLGTTVGAFYIQEWNTKPTIVTALGLRYGNGNPESIGGVSNGINARWAEVEIRLTNNRSF